ncbi:hypothetical protein CNEO3_720003 [Clostridium neonatale]|nr:hypothetical protein CNEO3_720003 [Clostridium neonatale]
MLAEFLIILEFFMTLASLLFVIAAVLSLFTIGAVLGFTKEQSLALLFVLNFNIGEVASEEDKSSSGSKVNCERHFPSLIASSVKVNKYSLSSISKSLFGIFIEFFLAIYIRSFHGLLIYHIIYMTSN